MSKYVVKTLYKHIWRVDFETDDYDKAIAQLVKQAKTFKKVKFITNA